MSCNGCAGNRLTVTIPPTNAPHLQPDGSIWFPEKAPEVEGYYVDPDNEDILIPDDPVPCPWRITGIILQQEGNYEPYHVCRNSVCPYATKPVTLGICKECPHKDGD